MKALAAHRPASPGAAVESGSSVARDAATARCPPATGSLQCRLADEAERNRRLEQELSALRRELAELRSLAQRLQASEASATHQARHDALTELPNRAAFSLTLAKALAQALAGPPTSTCSLAVLYIDLDAFKPINDQHGHRIGDEVLRIVGERLKRAMRAGDLVARLGGDEFGCLPAQPIDRLNLERLAGKLFDVAAAPMQIGSLLLQVSPSIGISIGPDDGATVDALLHSADAAMYRAKRQGSRHAFFA